MDVDILLLALEDFVPVVLNGIALWLLARACQTLDLGAGKYVLTSLLLIATGGLTKPIYKLILAVSDGSADVLVLDDLLFWFLAPGFLLLTTGLHAGNRADRGLEPGAVWFGPVAAAATVGAAAFLLAVDSAGWFVLLLGVATLGNVAAVAVLIRWTRAQGDRLAMVLYASSLLIVFGLAWAAASLEQTIQTQWGEQLLSTASQGLFLAASWRLTRRVLDDAGDTGDEVGAFSR